METHWSNGFPSPTWILHTLQESMLDWKTHFLVVFQEFGMQTRLHASPGGVVLTPPPPFKRRQKGFGWMGGRSFKGRQRGPGLF